MAQSSLLQGEAGGTSDEILENVAKLYETYPAGSIDNSREALAANARALKAAKSAVFVVRAANSGNLTTPRYAEAVIAEYEKGRDVDHVLVIARIMRANAFKAKKTPTTLFLDNSVVNRVFNDDQIATEGQNAHLLELAGEGWLKPRVFVDSDEAALPPALQGFRSVQVLSPSEHDLTDATVFTETDRIFAQVTDEAARAKIVSAVAGGLGGLTMPVGASLQFIGMRASEPQA